MAYTTYTTAALVCGSVDNNSADRAYLLFTEEFGMVWATARSVREERSRQRYALQDFSLIRVSLVKGKGGWRIGSVEAYGNEFLATTVRSERAGLLGLVKMLRRYVHGEERLSRIWADSLAYIEILRSDSDARSFSILQRVYTVRLLYVLGYIPDDATIADSIRAESLSAALTQYQPELAKHIDALIAHAEIVSQL